jgi:hypothetical protein
MAKKSFSKKPKVESRTADAIFDRFDQNTFDQKLRIKQALEIHEELKPYIPPLKPEEFATLEESILSEGRVRENLLIWKTPEGKYFLLDGHHRYQVINKHPERDLTWDIEVKEDLYDLEDARRFMRQLQFGRRNLTTHQMAYLRGRTYLDMKKSVGRSDDNEGRTREVLAKEFKISDKTIQRDAVFAAGVDRFLDSSLPLVLQDERDKILLHESIFLKGEIELLGKHPELPLELTYIFKSSGGSLKEVVSAPQDEWEKLMQAFLAVSDKEAESTPKTKDKANSSPVSDRFVKWWQQEQKQVQKIAKKGDAKAIVQKRQELAERIQKLQSLLSELPEN